MFFQKNPQANIARLRTVFRWILPCAAVCFTGITLLSACRGSLHPVKSAEFWVAPDGDDAHAGTRTSPFLTLTRARDAARLSGVDHRRIVLKGGKYYGASLLLGPEDSGLTICAAPREHPVLYGGTLVRNWQADEGKTFSAPVISATGASLRIPCLVVADQWRACARFPSSGTLKNLNNFKVRWMSTTGGGWEREPTPEELGFLRYAPGDLPPNFDVSSAEVTIFHKWDESRVGIAANDPAAGTLRLASAPGHPPGAFGVHDYVIWNIREGLDHPGQWFNDRSKGRLIYWPLEKEKINALEIVVPTNTSILRIISRAGGPVRNVTIEGLAFSGTTVPLQAGGFGAENYDGAVSVQNAEDCALRNLTVSAVGGHGIKASGNHLQIIGCVIREAGAGGIYAHGNSLVLSNNLVEKIGLNYPSSVGIMGGRGTGGLVAHNEVRDCPYSAFCFGGATNLVFEQNLAHHCMKVLGDGAGFYLFAGVDCVFRGNTARDFSDVSGGAGASSYYLDERTTRCIVERNISLGVAQPLQNHMATNNIIRNNIFISTGDMKLSFPRSSGFSFSQNVIQATGWIRIEGANAISNWGPNLFWTTNGIRRTTLERYQVMSAAEGIPEAGVLADPQFLDWRNGDVSLAPRSPALRLGFKPLSAERPGRL